MSTISDWWNRRFSVISRWFPGSTVYKFFSGLNLRRLFWRQNSETIEKSVLISTKDEKHWGRRKFKRILNHHVSSGDWVLQPLDLQNVVLRGIATKLILSAFTVLSPIGEDFKRMTWNLVTVRLHSQTNRGGAEVKAFPGGGLILYPGVFQLFITDELIGWNEDEVASLLAPSIVRILVRHHAERFSRDYIVDVIVRRFHIPKKLGHFLKIMYSYSWERKKVYEEDEMALLVMACAGFNAETAPEWNKRLAQCHDCSLGQFYCMSYRQRGRRLRASPLMLKAKKMFKDQEQTMETSTGSGTIQWFDVPYMAT